MIHIYIGEGKGKTTAAVGLAVRAMGWEQKVLFAQFFKSMETGELKALSCFKNLTVMRPSMRHKGFIWEMDENALKETKEDILSGFERISKVIFREDYSLVILDEILDIIHVGFLSEDCLIDLITKKPGTEFVLTGRTASENLLGKADYITNMVKLKHPYDKGQRSRKGIEY